MTTATLPCPLPFRVEQLGDPLNPYFVYHNGDRHAPFDRHGMRSTRVDPNYAREVNQMWDYLTAVEARNAVLEAENARLMEALTNPPDEAGR